MKANKAISLGESNTSKIQANSSKIESNDLEIDQLKNKVASQNEALNEIRVQLDDMRNRSLRKTLIFKNISFKKTHGMRAKNFYWRKLKHLYLI